METIHNTNIVNFCKQVADKAEQGQFNFFNLSNGDAELMVGSAFQHRRQTNTRQVLISKEAGIKELIKSVFNLMVEDFDTHYNKDSIHICIRKSYVSQNSTIYLFYLVSKSITENQ